MKKIILKDGLRVIYKHSKSDIITINVSVLAGSNNESRKNNGISHFLEHMMFEGTKTRTCLELNSAIEKYGGEMNAYTSNERTNYYIKIHRKHAKKAIEILGDMLINSTFDEKLIAKEKNVVLEEINMINDNPRQYQWILFRKHLFDMPFSKPVYGTKKIISSITRKDLLAYHSKHYTNNKMIITIVGDFKQYLETIRKYFTATNNKTPIQIPRSNLKNTRKSKIYKRKNMNQEYMIIGYRTPKRFSRGSYALDIISAILAKGQSGWLFDEIRTKRGLTYDLGVYHNPCSYYGYFAFYSSASKEKIKLIEKIYFQQVAKLQQLEPKALKEAISYIEGNFTLKAEESQEQADLISFYEECGNYKEYSNYIKKIKSLTVSEIKNTAKKLLNKQYTKIMLCTV